MQSCWKQHAHEMASHYCRWAVGKSGGQTGQLTGGVWQHSNRMRRRQQGAVRHGTERAGRRAGGQAGRRVQDHPPSGMYIMVAGSG